MEGHRSEQLLCVNHVAQQLGELGLSLLFVAKVLVLGHLKVAGQAVDDNAEEDVHQDEVANNDEGDEVGHCTHFTYRVILLHHCTKHDLRPIIARQHDEGEHQGAAERIKGPRRRPTVWVGGVAEELVAEQRVVAQHDEEQNKEVNDAVQRLEQRPDNNLERAPPTCQLEQLHQGDSSQKGDADIHFIGPTGHCQK